LLEKWFLAYKDFTIISQYDFGNRKRRTTIANSGLQESCNFRGVGWVGCGCFEFVFVNGLFFGRVLFWGVVRGLLYFGCFCVFS
jgi:hypothetical protein